ncbi:cytochrome c oxidase subunit 3 [Citrus sinensis]|uniref:Cytochrome c oxidase subunit 3 n=1 Tax=Citrus sinensis TaxID=2711 RepID=A0ACB8L8J5_CITSI|nr:cytochrome c oxidase subunit 3 [Citrus sinensis]
MTELHSSPLVEWFSTPTLVSRVAALQQWRCGRRLLELILTSRVSSSFNERAGWKENNRCSADLKGSSSPAANVAANQWESSEICSQESLFGGQERRIRILNRRKLNTKIRFYENGGTTQRRSVKKRDRLKQSIRIESRWMLPEQTEHLLVLELLVFHGKHLHLKSREGGEASLVEHLPSIKIERKLDPKEPFFTPLGGGGEGWGLHTTEAKWFMIESQRHSYHLVDPSPWPISGSLGALATTVGEIGGIWPPKGIWVLDPWEIPFLNTLILLSSGAAVTWAHHAILAGKEKRAVYALVATVLLALVFTGFQGMEYYQAPFTISDSIYGSTFYLATGFHGFHVIIGIEEIMADYVHQEMTRNWILIYLRLFLLIVIKDVFLSLVSFLNKSKNLMDRTELILGCYERYRPLEIGASTKTKLAPKSSTERNESCLQAELPELPGFPRPVVNPA